MRRFVLESKLSWLFTATSVAAMSMFATVGSGCGDGHDLSNGDEDVRQGMMRLDGVGGSDPTGAVSSAFAVSVSSSAVSTTSGSGGAGGGGGGIPGSGSGVTVSSSNVATVSVSVGPGGGGPGGGGPGAPTAFWKFDDCQPSSIILDDFSGNSVVANRSTKTTCAPGIDGSAVSFAQKGAIVQAPDQSLLTLDKNVTIAAWVNPAAVDGTQTIAQKRVSGDFSFTLSIINGDAVFKVTLASGKVVTSRAPVSANVWTHVAGQYNGEFVFLFLNGEQVGQVFAAGTLENVSAPIQIGSNGQKQPFVGLIDEVWLSTNPVDPSQIAALSCINREPTLSVTPSSSGVVQPDTTVTYNISVTNNDAGLCPPSSYFLQLPNQPQGFNFFIDPIFIPNVVSGQTVTFPFSVTGTSDAEPGVHELPFDIFDFSDFSSPLSGQVTYELPEPTGCFVRTGRELIAKGVSVVDDPIRTTFNGPASDPRTGAWTFGKLIENMAPTPAEAPAFATQLFSTWLTDQTVNGFTVNARPQMQSQVLSAWPRNPDNTLDLKNAPLRLLAIVNRIDLRDLSAGRAGEGRFVFGVLGAKGEPLEFTVILEYSLPATTEAEVLDWANSWHALGALPFPSEDYNAALQAITTRFAGRNAAPGRPNGSALSQLRTNEIALEFPWELREFALSQATGLLQPSTVKLTPDQSFDQTQTLADFVNANEADIILEKFTVPDTFQGSPFLGGSSRNNLDAWSAPGIINNEARHHFSLNTCNGCHGGAETNTAFLQVFPRQIGSESSLSGFMTGTTVFDPVSFEPRTFNDLGRRKVDLEGLVCAGSPAVPLVGGAQAAKALPPVSIAKGINRVH